MKICSVTAKKNAEDTPLYKSIEALNIDIDIDMVVDNTQHLAVVYNQLMEHHKDEDYVVFIHDDVWVKGDFRQVLSRYLENNPLVGVAGATSCNFQKPCLWHLMSERKNLRGVVDHGNMEKHSSTYFGVVPHEVVIIDGVFMAMSNELLQSDVKFDENNPTKFHFYDLDFSIQAFKSGFRPIVAHMPIIHESGGLSSLDDEEWLKGQEYFYNKYN